MSRVSGDWEPLASHHERLTEVADLPPQQSGHRPVTADEDPAGPAGRVTRATGQPAGTAQSEPLAVPLQRRLPPGSRLVVSAVQP